LVAGAFGVSTASAGTKDQLDDAKAELAEIQQELDAATAEWHEATIALDGTKAQIIETRDRIGGLEQRVDRIEARLTKRAVIAFTNGPASTIDLLLSSGSFTEFSDRLEFLGSMAQDDVDLVLEQEVAQEQLRREREDLLALEEAQTAEAERLAKAQAKIDAEFDRVNARLAELTEKYREELAAQKELQIIGQTPNPSGALQVCPVAGPNSFVDSFGWPRVGHSHQGIDLISPFGTPIVAAHPGSVSQSSSSSGGLQTYVHGSGGYTFYAHLSSYGASGSVGAGTVIGYVGSTGNANPAAPHLHFAIFLLGPDRHWWQGTPIDPHAVLR
jgi:murein DD-endopeptidase MepM/ murein hydrolase activator NlpD